MQAILQYAMNGTNSMHLTKSLNELKPKFGNSVYLRFFVLYWKPYVHVYN